MPQLPTEDPPQGALSAAISTLLVQTFRTYVGRGPTKARTWLHANLITTLLEDTLTDSEQTLARNGHDRLVIAVRDAQLSAMRAELVAGVSELTGREVIAVMGDTHLKPDMAMLAFILTPRAGQA